MRDVVYIGSKDGSMNEILPNASRIGKQCISGYNRIEVALSFIYHTNGDLDTFKDVRDGIYVIVERRKDVFNNLYNKPGYIYEFDSKDFEHLEKTWEPEMVSFQECLKPLNIKYIENIFNELENLEKLGKVKLYHYPNRPDYVPADDSDLIEKYLMYEKRGVFGSLFKLKSFFPELADRIPQNVMDVTSYKLNGMEVEKKVVWSKNKDIHFPYILISPIEPVEHSNLFINLESCPATMSGKFDDMIEQLINHNLLCVNRMASIICSEFKMNMLIPIFPNISNFYSHFFGSVILNNDLSKIDNAVEEEEKYRFKDIHNQIYLMIKEVLNKYQNLDKKAWIYGYSANAKFATQFSILHPDIISFNISGGTTGLSTLPVKEYEGVKLPYPIGVSNIPDFDFEEYKKIHHFFFIGNEDNNDPASPKFEASGNRDANGNVLPKLDENGNPIFIYNEQGELTAHYNMCYTDEEVRIINKFYGSNILERFYKNEKIYKSLGMNSEHKVYAGNHITIDRDIVVKDIIEFIKKDSKNN